MRDNARKRLPDTPWHVGYVTKEDDDPRRHISRCIHKIDEECHCVMSSCFMLKCMGSAHCVTYAEDDNQWNRYKESMIRIDDIKNDLAEKRALLYRIKKQEQANKVMRDPNERKKYIINPKMIDCPICKERLKSRKCNYCGFVL